MRMSEEPKTWQGLSRQALSFWGKTGEPNDEGDKTWLPLYIHLNDTAGIAERLWDEWLPISTRRVIASAFDNDEKLARAFVVFICGIHDIGKATPIFEAKTELLEKPEQAGLHVRADLRNEKDPTHPIAGELILSRYLEERVFEDELGRDAWNSRRQIEAISCIIGAHHGNFPSRSRILDGEMKEVELGWTQAAGNWKEAQYELIDWALHRAGISHDFLDGIAHHCLTAATESLVDGLLIMADWLASNQDLFPACSVYEPIDNRNLERRVDTAWRDASILPSWHEENPHPLPFEAYFESRFSFPAGSHARPVQAAAAKIAWETKDLGLLIIEAPMGEGKTEAALAAAELMAWRYGMGGVCVALPTMATTDAMFSRVDEWLEHLPELEGSDEKSIYLAHGKSRLNEQFQGIIRNSLRESRRVHTDDDEGKSGGVTVSEWMLGRKRGMLANFVVCTVDQVLMGALCMRHLSLRQLAIMNKVIVIDECHAYDLYMRQYLERLLEWLGFWHVPVILLSATLPSGQREQMTTCYLSGRRAGEGSGTTSAESRRLKSVPAYLRRKPAAAVSNAQAASSVPAVDAYPLLTYTEGQQKKWKTAPTSGRSVNVEAAFIQNDMGTLSEVLRQLLRDGGCAGVICDTVGRAQAAAQELSMHFGLDAVVLDHSRFMDVDRFATEKKLRDALGPAATTENGKRPDLLIAVGTQVLEQSLDIDFDVLICDIAPIDLLLQRLGRTHRHARGDAECGRPKALRKARCFIRGISEWDEEGPEFVPGIAKVYDQAALLEGAAVLGMTDEGAEKEISLPHDIPRLVRTAYSSEVAAFIPEGWLRRYKKACAKRSEKNEEKTARAQPYLLHDIARIGKSDGSLIDLAESQQVMEDNPKDSDKGQRAVRDTQDSVEVLVVRGIEDGGIALLPWVGSEDVQKGARIPCDCEPEYAVASLLLQCAVRLPLSVCPQKDIDSVIHELEDGCWQYVSCWQQSPWLAGQLLLVMHGEDGGKYRANLNGKILEYTAHFGLSTVHG
jgi:CRISPR-associated endonuclease/helicase Cas3